jgi:hypothetical protein
MIDIGSGDLPHPEDRHLVAQRWTRRRPKDDGLSVRSRYGCRLYFEVREFAGCRQPCALRIYAQRQTDTRRQNRSRLVTDGIVAEGTARSPIGVATWAQMVSKRRGALTNDGH